MFRQIQMMMLLSVLLIISCSSPKGEHAANHLHKATSPYLQEHADNPVNWYEWGDEALAKAKTENKPLLISIGYASCHWCHVMEEESFMDTTVARIMNESFVCIKVDREERPDIDNIYMHACQLLNNGEGGWPLNAFALPDGKPFFAGTYYAKDNWIQLLKQVSESYLIKKNKVELQANSLTYGMIDNDQLLFTQEKKNMQLDKNFYQTVFQQVKHNIDLVEGGLKGKQKFPTPSLWDFMMQYQYLTKDKEALAITINTLTKMALGGIYDHIGGGFARYATDSQWRVPHFEKMLYDNGQLVSIYAQAYQLTKNDFFKQILEQTLTFIERDLLSKEGGFYSSLNADTEDGEGVFYTWKYNSFKQLLNTKDADLITNYYNLTDRGNWEKGNNILFAQTIPATFAASKKLSVDDFNLTLNTARQTLLAERNKRKKPSIDTKILTSWNAIMLNGYIDAYAATGTLSYLQHALKNADFIEKKMLDKDGKVMRSFKDGNVSISGFLDDHAWTAYAFAKLYQVTFDKHWLQQSKKITDHALQHYYDSITGMFFYTASTAKDLVVRKMETRDHVIPSSNAVFAKLLYQLGTLFEDESYINKSTKMLLVMTVKIKQDPAYHAEWAKLSGLIAYGMYEVAVMGQESKAKNQALQKNYLPNVLYMGGDKEEDLPLLEGKLQEGKTMIYVCSNKTCKLPVQEVAQALKQIK